MADFQILKAESCTVRVAADGYHVATVSIGMNNREAYAALFAAAPEMLAALIFAVERIKLANTDGDPILSAWLPDAEAATLKAEGRSNG